MGNAMTRFEYFIKKQGKLNMYDMYAIAKLQKGEHPELNVFEKADILHIIRYKKIDIAKMGYYIWIDDKGNAVKKYNQNCKNVRENLSKDQWLKLIRYYRGFVDSMDTIGDEKK